MVCQISGLQGICNRWNNILQTCNRISGKRTVFWNRHIRKLKKVARIMFLKQLSKYCSNIDKKTVLTLYNKEGKSICTGNAQHIVRAFPHELVVNFEYIGKFNELKVLVFRNWLTFSNLRFIIKVGIEALIILFSYFHIFIVALFFRKSIS